MIVFPKGSLANVGKLYEIKEGQTVKITISILND